MYEKNNFHFAVMQTDERQNFVCNHLKDLGYTTHGIESVSIADVILLPTPLNLSDKNLEDIFKVAKCKAVFFAGKINEESYKLAQQYDVTLIDYMQYDELAILNAIPTAEGTINLMMTNLAFTLWNTNVLLIGFGRITKILAPRLISLGMKVTVCARSASSRAMARAIGCNVCDFKNINNNVKIIVNTVPHLVINSEFLKKLKKDTLIIDLASMPGGVDFKYAEKLKIKTIHALSLPSKCAPVSSGEFIVSTILNILRERGVNL